MLVVVNNSLVIIFMFSAHKPQMINNLRPIHQIIPKVFIVISKILCKVLINHHIMPWKRSGNHHHQHHGHHQRHQVLLRLFANFRNEYDAVSKVNL